MVDFITNYVVSVPLDKQLAELIGKKGSENSITFYNRTYQGDVIVALVPTSIEEKFYAVAESMLMSDQIVLSTASVDKQFGEIAIACGLLKKRVVLTDDNNVDRLVKESGIEDCVVSGRGSVLDKIIEKKHIEQNTKKWYRIDVDKSFDVKGIGTVVLGIVTKGSVSVHDVLAHRSGKKATVRSIQSQDKDFETVPVYTRVGLGLKGIESDDIKKGDLLTRESVAATDSISAELIKSKIAREDIEAGKIYGFVSNFSYTNATMSSIEDSKAIMRLEKPLQIEKGDQFLLIRKEQPRIFASGRVL